MDVEAALQPGTAVMTPRRVMSEPVLVLRNNKRVSGSRCRRHKHHLMFADFVSCVLFVLLLSKQPRGNLNVTGGKNST